MVYYIYGVIQKWSHRKREGKVVPKRWQKVTTGGRGRESLNIVTSPIRVFILIIYFISPCLQTMTRLISCTTFSCFNKYQKFSNDFPLNSCTLSFDLLKRRPWRNIKWIKSLNFYKGVVYFAPERGRMWRMPACKVFKKIFLQ